MTEIQKSSIITHNSQNSIYNELPPPPYQSEYNLSTNTITGTHDKNKELEIIIQSPPITRSKNEISYYNQPNDNEDSDIHLSEFTTNSSETESENNFGLTVNKRHPYFTVIVSLLELFLVIYSLILNHGFESLQVNPFAGPSAEVLIELGARYTPKILDGEWWRIITAQFLHAGIIHLILNLITQIPLGIVMESSFGSIRIAIVYIVSGIGGNLLSGVFLPKIVSVGASSSLFGILSIYLSDLIQNWKSRKHRIRNLLYYTLLVLISLAMGLLPKMDNFAHIGGFIVGFLCGMILLPSSSYKFRSIFLIIVSSIGLVTYFVLLFYALYMRINTRDWCCWCIYLSCIDVYDWCNNYK